MCEPVQLCIFPFYSIFNNKESVSRELLTVKRQNEDVIARMIRKTKIKSQKLQIGKEA